MTKWNLPHNSKYGLTYKNQSISYTILIKGKQTHIVIDTEKSFDKIHHSFMGKKHKKQPNNPPRNRRNLSELHDRICKNKTKLTLCLMVNS